MPLTCKSWPIPAVIAIPRQPPPMTRKVGMRSFDPAVLALIIPVKIKPTTVKAMMLHAALPAEGANAPAKGTRPPAVKLMADAIAA